MYKMNRKAVDISILFFCGGREGGREGGGEGEDHGGLKKD